MGINIPTTTTTTKNKEENMQNIQARIERVHM